MTIGPGECENEEWTGQLVRWDVFVNHEGSPAMVGTNMS